MKHIQRVLFGILFLLLTLQITACSTPRGKRLPPDEINIPLEEPGATFEEALANHLTRPASLQETRRAQAEEQLRDFRIFERESGMLKDSQLRHWYYRDYSLEPGMLGVGVGNSITALKAALAIDPAMTESWCALGRLCAGVGDVMSARRYLDRAFQVAQAWEQAGQPVDDDLLRVIHRERAWALRDLARWDEGLTAVSEALAAFPGDRDLVLIKGLLLAGAGRTPEAMSLAVRMPPYSYPQHDLFHYGQRDQTSDYANRWIKSQAMLAIGDYELARHVIGELTSYPYRRYLPHQERFWNDVGLVAELDGDEQAGAYYALGLISHPFLGFFPWVGSNLEPMVQGFPAAETPYFTSYGDRFLLGGSPLAYAASQMNRMTFNLHARQRELAAGRAKLALDIAERRNIRPDIVRAMRGRLFFAADELALARQDLEAANEAFVDQGRADAGTSLLLGLLDMTEGHHDRAVEHFHTSLAEDPDQPVAWRSLGVSLVHLGRKEEAAVAMDEALGLEPRSVAGLYNRGLLHLQAGHFGEAVTDLDLAYRLEPENHEVQRLLQMAASGYRNQGGRPEDLAEDPDQLALTAEEILARLEEDIAGFFAVPDSLVGRLSPDDPILLGLERQYFTAQDLTARKILALAYMDRGMYEATQALLSPGWGVDLTPEEEVMLLYVDRSLGEKVRARELADLMLRGERSASNPYLLIMLAEEDRKHWTQTILARNHYTEGYSASVQGNGDAKRYARYMRIGFQNLRMSHNQQDVGHFHFDTPFIRSLNDRGGVESATSGARAVGGRRAGNVVK
jgi:tetratricopeptide (TPR) repeat protein|nr:tetratricopeptide repeat protein [Candidatus Krumholzibacteria bacterium]